MYNKKERINDARPRKKFEKIPINGTKFTIAISSAKGGVGKSTFATNLALSLKSKGLKIGLLDADIYGPTTGILLSQSESETPLARGFSGPTIAIVAPISFP